MRLTVIVPTREQKLTSDNITLRTLEQQTWRDFCIAISYDKNKCGASWARNEGFKYVGTELVMFCDDDIEWACDAFEQMINCLDANPTASYVYCGYSLANSKISMRPFDPDGLKRYNYISTMSIIRTADFPKGGFDEGLQRFQDWDLWLNMLLAGKAGVWCGSLLFTTQVRPGLTYNNSVTTKMADTAIRTKYGAWMRL